MYNSLFPTDLSLSSLLKAQRLVREKAVIYDDFAIPALVAGVDQAFRDTTIISGIVTVDAVSMQVKEEVSYTGIAPYPYVPTFLSFREGPAIISAYQKLKLKPDLLMVDGCGINHPRGAGLSTHVGVALDIPTIGVTKHILCGEGKEPEELGEVRPLVFQGRQVGWLIKSCTRCRPIVVAPGHRISMEGALKITMNMLKGHKLPEPCLLAHKYVNRLKQELSIFTSSG